MRPAGEAKWQCDINVSGCAPHRLQYTSCRQNTDEISDARVYGGVHFQTDQVADQDLGRVIGAAVYKGNLRPTHKED